MGVAGDFLPRVLESTGRIVDLKDDRDGVICSKKRRKRPLRIGIDVSAWIYRAGFAFGEKLMHDERHLTSYGRANLQKEQQVDGIEPQTPVLVKGTSDEASAEKIRDYCEACANYVVRRLELLKNESHANLLVVFDGRSPPIKTATVQERKKSRRGYQNLREDNGDTGNEKSIANNGDIYETKNNNMDVEADIEERVKANRRAGPGKHVSRIVDVIIEKLRKRSKEEGETNNGPSNDYLAAWMVAPYEADSQLAYLSKQSYIDLVITEDTDLIAHGCRSVMYKCLENQNNINADDSGANTDSFDVHIDITSGKLVEFQDLGGTKVFSGGPPKPDLTDFTPIMMAVLFVLLGCDYNGHRKLKGIGIVKACKIVRKAFLESSRRNTTETDSASEVSQLNRIVPMSPASVASNASPRKKRKNQLPTLEIVWKEAYEQSFDSFYTEEFKKEYQKSFVEALWMYRHPIVFDPMIRACIQCPSPVSDELGDPELLDCKEYSELSSNPIRIIQVVGELPPTQEECISIAEGRAHTQWKLRKPTPIYSNNDNEKKTQTDSSRRKRKSPSQNFNGRNPASKNSCSPAFRSKRNKIGKENNESTKSDRRRSLDSDEIASLAAGGFKKDDKRPKNGMFASRNLFPGGQNMPQHNEETRSPNLLASTTPEQSTQSSSKATLSVRSGTQSSSKATPKTSQSSSKASVNLLTSSQSNQFETPILQTQQQFSNWQTPSPVKPRFQTPSSTQEELYTQQLDSQLPPNDEEEEPSQFLTQEMVAEEPSSMETPKRRMLPRAAKKTPPSAAYRTP